MTADELISKYARETKEDSPIIFFLSRNDNGHIQHQGYIFGLNEDGGGVAQLFEWFCGYESEIFVFTKAFLGQCSFYTNDFDLRAAIKRAKGA